MLLAFGVQLVSFGQMVIFLVVSNRVSYLLELRIESMPGLSKAIIFDLLPGFLVGHLAGLNLLDSQVKEVVGGQSDCFLDVFKHFVFFLSTDHTLAGIHESSSDLIVATLADLRLERNFVYFFAVVDTLDSYLLVDGVTVAADPHLLQVVFDLIETVEAVIGYFGRLGDDGGALVADLAGLGDAMVEVLPAVTDDIDVGGGGLVGAVCAEGGEFVGQVFNVGPSVFFLHGYFVAK